MVDLGVGLLSICCLGFFSDAKLITTRHYSEKRNSNPMHEVLGPCIHGQENMSSLDGYLEQKRRCFPPLRCCACHNPQICLPLATILVTLLSQLTNLSAVR